jgi:hypothetical protein
MALNQLDKVCLVDRLGAIHPLGCQDSLELANRQRAGLCGTKKQGRLPSYFQGGHYAFALLRCSAGAVPWHHTRVLLLTNVLHLGCRRFRRGSLRYRQVRSPALHWRGT